MILSLQTNKSLHQLPLITNKSSKSSFPMIDQMKTLHISNIRNIKKQQTESANMIQKYLLNKSQYMQTVYKKNQQNVHKVLRSLQNKSVVLMKENSEKQRKQNDLYKNHMSLSKDKIKTTYLKEKAKLQSALSRKQEFNQSHYKEVFVKKPNYRKIFLEELGKSQELHKTTIQKLVKAQNRRKQIKYQKENQSKGKLDNSILYAQSYISNLETQKQTKMVQKSITKMRQSQRLIGQLKEKNRSASETSRKSTQEKFMKAQQFRIQKQKQSIQSLQEILQQKRRKTQAINQRKVRNLQMLAMTLKKSRSKHLEKVQERSRSLMSQAELKSQEIMNGNHEKWKFLTGIKEEFDKVKNHNLYESQQVSLRC